MNSIKGMSITTALATHNIWSFLFQFFLVFATAEYFGFSATGQASLALTLATAICCFCVSDTKSISFIEIQKNGNSRRVFKYRFYSFILIFVTIFFISSIINYDCKLLLIFCLFRFAQSMVDETYSHYQYYSMKWRIVFSTSFRHFVSIFVYIVCAESGFSFVNTNIYCIITFVGLSLFESLSFKYFGQPTHLSDNANMQRDEFQRIFVSLALSQFVGLFPQFLLRYYMSIFSSLEFVGQYSIQYQVFMGLTPIISALGQSSISRKRHRPKDFIFQSLQILAFSAAFCMVAFLLLPMLSQGISFFMSIFFLPPLDSLVLGFACSLLTCSIYLGFYTLKISSYNAQLVSGSIFFVIIAAFGAILGFLFGGLGVLLAVLLACIWRSGYLFFVILTKLKG